jgi:sugar lactone lactonase YvrE
VATPQFDPTAGTYSADLWVSINDSTSGAIIYYTTDGSTPTTSSSLYGAAISITGPNTTETIKAIAAKTGMKTSAVGSATYTVLYQYTLTTSAGTGGTVTTPAASAVTVNYGAATNITAAPGTGFVFASWTLSLGSGVSFGDANSASTTVTLTVSNATIKANFAPLIATVAGNGVQGYLGDGGAATSAELYNPYGVAVDTAGNLYIADSGNHRIRKVDTNGKISTVAGKGAAGYSGDGGAATIAELKYPIGVAVDAAGNLYIGDSNNNVVRKVTTDGKITTVAGNGTAGSLGDGGAATSAELSSPAGVAVDTAGNLYIADYSNSRIRKVTSGGTITTFAGTGAAGYSGDNGAATSANLNEPNGVALDTGGNLYIADVYNHRIRKVSTGGIITTVAGNGTQGYSGDGGAAVSAELYLPYSVAVDSSGNIYIADFYNQRIRGITAGVIRTVTGTGTGGFSGDGGLATAAQVNYPTGVGVDTAGNLYFADWNNNRIREVP